MAWLKIKKAPLMKSKKRNIPDGLWKHCDACQSTIYSKEFEANTNVCPKCEHHYPLSAKSRIQNFLDPNSFVETNSELMSTDPLKFKDYKSYAKRLKDAHATTGLRDAIITGEGKLLDRRILIGAFDFFFMGGSMGSVVGEKLSQVFQAAAKKDIPAVIFSTSGGARMHEGLLSLMQMAKTCTALSYMREKGVPMISILTHPTTGGVAASYAMLGDINIGEPKALIGFAGPRVIQQTMRQSLPEGFQTSEYLLEHGMLDLICHRRDLRTKVNHIINILYPKKD
jgi:acetyl-CoA carboxylase carboxyl transferase subunit beta